MSKRTRGAIATTMGIIAFIGGGAALGAVFGLKTDGEVYYGVTGAFLSGAMAAGALVAAAALLAVLTAVLEWVQRGDDS